MKNLLITVLAFAIFCNAKAQSIWSNTITGSNPGLVNPFTTGQVISGNWTVSGIGHSQNVSGASGNDIYNTNLWSTSGVLDESRYLYFTLTPNAGHKINLESFVYTGQASSNGPVSFAFRSSIDGYTNNIGLPNATGATISLSAFQNINVPLTFRLYAYGATDVLGSFGISQFEFKGDTPLPVKFGSVQAVYKEGFLNVEWETESEVNNSHFTIDISKDGRKFSPARTVSSKALNGNSGQRLSYQERLEVGKLNLSMLMTPFIILLLGAFAFKRKSFSCILFFVFTVILIMPSCSKNNLGEIHDETKLYVRVAQTDIDGKTTYSKIVKAIK